MLPDSLLVSPLAQLVREKMGGDTTYIEKRVDVTTVKSMVLTNNPNRLFWIIVNVSNYSAQLASSPDMFDGIIGIPLATNGGMVSMDYLEDGETVGNAVWVRTNGGTANLHIREVLRI